MNLNRDYTLIGHPASLIGVVATLHVAFKKHERNFPEATIMNKFGDLKKI